MLETVREHLRLLSIFHYVVGGMGFLFSLIPVVHLMMGLFLLLAPADLFEENKPDRERLVLESGAETAAGAGERTRVTSEGKANSHDLDRAALRMVGGIFVGVASVMMIAGIALSSLIVIAGKRLAAHRSHTFCLVVAGLACLFMPYGTALGVLTILTLLKPEAKRLFGLPATA